MYYASIIPEMIIVLLLLIGNCFAQGTVINGDRSIVGSLCVGSSGTSVDRLSLCAAPVASATRALLNLSNTALSGGSAAGTYIGANPAVCTGNFLDFQLANAARAKLTCAGALTVVSIAGDATNLTSIPASQLTGTIASATQDLITRTGTLVAGATGAGFTVALSTSTITGTLADARLSSNVPLLNISNTFTDRLLSSATIAAGSYGVQIAGAAGADRDILLVGAAGVSNGFTVQVIGGVMTYTVNGVAGGTGNDICENGGVLATSATGTCIASSLRYKEAITPFVDGLEMIRKLDTVSFKYKARQKDRLGNVLPQVVRHGLIAETVQTVLPEFVWELNGQPEAVYYIDLIPVLIRAVQQLDNRIKVLIP